MCTASQLPQERTRVHNLAHVNSTMPAWFVSTQCTRGTPLAQVRTVLNKVPLGLPNHSSGCSLGRVHQRTLELEVHRSRPNAEADLVQDAVLVARLCGLRRDGGTCSVRRSDCTQAYESDYKQAYESDCTQAYETDCTQVQSI